MKKTEFDDEARAVVNTSWRRRTRTTSVCVWDVHRLYATHAQTDARMIAEQQQVLEENTMGLIQQQAHARLGILYTR